MDNISKNEPGEEPVVNESVTPAGEEPQGGDISSAIAGMSADQLREVLEAAEAGPSDRSQDPPKDTEAEAIPAGEKPQDPPAEVDPQGTQDEPAQPSEPEHSPKRLSVLSLPVDQRNQLADALNLVRSGKAATIQDALRQVAGEPAESVQGDPSATGEAPTQPKNAEAVTHPDVAEVQTRIRDLRDQRRQALADYDTENVALLTDQIEDAQAELLRAERAAEQRQAAQHSYQEKFNSVVDAVEAKYPQATDDTSAFYRILDDRVAAAHARGDKALANPNYLMEFADQVAADLGISKQTAKPPTPPARPSRPAGSSLAPGHAHEPRPTTDQVRQMIRSVPIDVLKQAVFTR